MTNFFAAKVVNIMFNKQKGMGQSVGTKKKAEGKEIKLKLNPDNADEYTLIDVICFTEKESSSNLIHRKI